MLKYNGGFIPIEKEYVFDFENNEFLLGSFFPTKYGTDSMEHYYQIKHVFYIQIYYP
ncbi:hypothetical protein SAMN05216324_10215 [Chryseobacterium limigenitum]|uniref:Uncharacterized protein n=1 Tax=Chryseobacterium limigenitum TaxID=1612149 RepID=A0A1K2IF80_9FLAO|nr:hypothetical protein SAMN05216324_10215 [Chryseobacterium limigenitum]